MASQKSEKSLARFAVVGLLLSATALFVTGVRGDFPAMFGFENGFVAVAGIQLLAAVSIWVKQARPGAATA